MMGLKIKTLGYYKITNISYNKEFNQLFVILTKFNRRNGDELGSIEFIFNIQEMNTFLDLNNLKRTAYLMIKEINKYSSDIIDILEEVSDNEEK